MALFFYIFKIHGSSSIRRGILQTNMLGTSPSWRYDSPTLQHSHGRSVCSSSEKLATGLRSITLENTGLAYRTTGSTWTQPPQQACADTNATKGHSHLIALRCLGGQEPGALQSRSRAPLCSFNCISRRVPGCPKTKRVSHPQKSSSQSRCFGGALRSEASISSTCLI